MILSELAIAHKEPEGDSTNTIESKEQTETCTSGSSIYLNINQIKSGSMTDTKTLSYSISQGPAAEGYSECIPRESNGSSTRSSTLLGRLA